MKLSDCSTSNAGALLILGPPGTGKTTLCTQLPRPIINNIDDTTAGPIRFVRANKLKQDADIINPFKDDKGDLLPRAERFRALGRAINAQMKNPEFDTIVVDSLTSLVDAALDECRRVHVSKANPNGLRIADGEKNYAGEQVQIQDWETFKAIIKHLVTTMKASGKLIVFTGHIKVDKDELSGVTQQFIALPGQLATIIAGYFDDCWYLTKSEVRGADGKLQTAIKIRTVPDPLLRQDQLGLKGSLGFGNVFDLDFVKIQNLLKK